jgi:SAM-dependent methyltransferase
MQKQQEAAWDAEYRNPRMLVLGSAPSADVVRFVRTLKKEARKQGERLDLYGWKVLDLGSGTGRNSFYFAEQGAEVTGYEFSEAAVKIARHNALRAGLPISYEKRDIGEPYPLPDASFDLVLDVTSSNSLLSLGRATYLREVARVLKPGGYFFVRALCLDGDVHAKTLLRERPGPEAGMYILPDLGVAERVFTEQEFRDTYGPYFTIEKLEKSQHYAMVSGRRYKRAYWIARMRKPEGE